MRRFIHVCGDLIDARQRVQHLHVVARALEVAGAQHKLRLHVGVLGRIQTLFLHAGHIQNINDVDKPPPAWYFQQAGNGIFARQALLALVLNRELAL